MIPAHSYGNPPKGARLEARGYSLDSFGGKNYLVKMKIWGVGNTQRMTLDVLGEARFGIVLEKGENEAGEKIEAGLRTTRALADAIKRASNMPVDEPTGSLFYKPIPRSIASNTVKEQMLEAMFFGCFLSDIRSDALYRTCNGPIKQEYLNFLPYKPKPEGISRN
jgi:hypothetical protein